MALGVYVALLRGINVGGKNRLPMKDLAGMFRNAGCDNVRTYIQSGNVLFEADRALAARVPGLVAKAIARDFGFAAPVVTRTRAELEAVARGNPIPDVSEPKALHVAFLLDRPRKAALASLDPDRSPPDTYVVRGREIYLHCPNGVARTKLTTAYFDAVLETTSTLRNWRTVLTLFEKSAAS